MGRGRQQIEVYFLQAQVQMGPTIMVGGDPNIAKGGKGEKGEEEKNRGKKGKRGKKEKKGEKGLKHRFFRLNWLKNFRLHPPITAPIVATCGPISK